MEHEVISNIEGVKNLSLQESNVENLLIESPDQIVIKSFDKFLLQNNITKENAREKLTREKLCEWDFKKEIESQIDKEFNEIPFLSELYALDKDNTPRLNRKGNLVKFNCMVQNVFENQLYMGVGFDTKQNQGQCEGNNLIIINEFYEHESDKDKDNSPMMIDGEEDLYSQDDMCSLTGTIFMERLVLNCVVLPGLSPYLYQPLKFNQDSYANLLKKKIVVYDYSNSSHKVNEELCVVGVAYERDNEIIIHAWKILNNFIPQISIQNVTQFDYTFARNLIYQHFLNFFNNDELLAEYLVLFLTSQIYSRIGTHFIGKLTINIINQKETLNSLCDYTNYLENFVKIISNFTTTFTPTISSLNKKLLYPRFDVNSEELVQGLLQTPKHTFLLIDERQMNEGKLEDLGCKNFNAIQNLLDFQILIYEYPYSQVEIPHDTQILIVTDKIKSLFNSLQLLEIPFMNGEESYNRITHGEKLAVYDKFMSNLEAIDVMRLWFNLTRSREEFTTNFNISSDVSQRIQKDFLLKKDYYTADDLDTSIKLARLYAISYGRSELSFEDYEFVRKMEGCRKERIEKLKK